MNFSHLLFGDAVGPAAAAPVPGKVDIGACLNQVFDPFFLARKVVDAFK